MSVDEHAGVGVYELDPDKVKVQEDNVEWSRWILRVDPMVIGRELSRALPLSQFAMGRVSAAAGFAIGLRVIRRRG